MTYMYISSLKIFESVSKLHSKFQKAKEICTVKNQKNNLTTIKTIPVIYKNIIIRVTIKKSLNLKKKKKKNQTGNMEHIETIVFYKSLICHRVNIVWN